MGVLADAADALDSRNVWGTVGQHGRLASVSFYPYNHSLVKPEVALEWLHS